MSSQTYDTIAERYRDSKWLLFRHFIERYTVMTLLGDLHGRTVLDMACGEGVYARQFKRAGAAEVTGVDISPAMVALAEAQEMCAIRPGRTMCLSSSTDWNGHVRGIGPARAKPSVIESPTTTIGRSSSRTTT